MNEHGERHAGSADSKLYSALRPRCVQVLGLYALRVSLALASSLRSAGVG